MITDKLCVIPWIHMNVESNGTVIPCCMTAAHNYTVGDANTQTIEQLWNNNAMTALRRDMINGIEPRICNKCFDQERVIGQSSRTINNQVFKNSYENIPNITNSDGTVTELKLKYWDFRFSNICNFKCRSCGPRYSSAWVPDANKMKMSVQDKVWHIEQVDNKPNYEFLKQHIDYVEKIYFAGGEPLMMQEHWDTLELIDKHNRYDVRVLYNTNLSMLAYNKRNVLDYWKNWKKGKLVVSVSIDEIDERAEYVRSGTNWTKLEENLTAVSTLDNVILWPSFTVSVYNVFRIPMIIDRLLALNVISKEFDYKNFHINVLTGPDHLRINVLPMEFRREILKLYSDYCTSYKQRYNVDLGSVFDYIIDHLKQPQNESMVQKFIKYSNTLDEIRNESTFSVIPELRCLL
jgi:radical SAM protein with 4Fe4S-binding SPASM domain